MHQIKTLVILIRAQKSQNKISVCSFLFTRPFGYFNLAFSQEKQPIILPVKGFCIAAPSQEGLDKFLVFIEKDECKYIDLESLEIYSILIGDSSVDFCLFIS